jgi:SET domain-containing protein
MPKRQKNVVVKRSEIGLGLFATADISKETKIIQYTGARISNADTDKYKGRYLFKLDENYTIDGRSRSNLARYINHSCRPNAYTEIIDGEIWVVAKRRIKAFEEITYHYGKEYFNFFIRPKGCKCSKCSNKGAK